MPMRRLFHYVFTVLSALSLVLCPAAAMRWVDSGHFPSWYNDWALQFGLSFVLPLAWLAWRPYNRELERRRLASGLCPACSYDLTGNVSGICPECGTPIGPNPSVSN